MNKTTIGALVAVIVLAVVVFFVSMEGEKAELKTLELPGIKMGDPKLEKVPDEEKTAEEIAEDKEKEAAEALKIGPPDRITIVRKGLHAVLEKSAEDKWKLVKPVVAQADTYKVRGMLRAFTEPLKSNYSRVVKVEALSKLGLDESNRIRVTLAKGDEILVDLLLGRVDRKDDSGVDLDTMVMLPADLESPVYYRIPGKDLRRAFDVKLTDIRDKKIFSFGKDDIQGITIEDPRDPARGKIVLKKGGGEKPEWSIVEPGGADVDNLSGFASSLAGTRADEYLDQLPGADEKALDKAYRITATVKEGEGTATVTLELGAGRKKGVYARLVGRDGYFLVPKYTAEQLMKSFNDFRQKKLFTFKGDEITEVTIADGGEPPIHLLKRGENWTFLVPAGVAVANSKVKSLTNGISNLRVGEYLSTQPAPAETGLNTTSTTVSFKVAGAETTLRIGKLFKNEKDQERFYAQVVGKDEVFTLMRYSRDNLVKSVDELKDKRLFLVAKEEITHVTLVHPDQKLEFEGTRAADKTTWKMTSPQVIENVELEQLVATLATLDVDSVEAAKSAAEVGIGTDSFTISFSLADGTTHAVTISEEVTDNKNYAQSSTSPEYAGAILLLSKYKVDNLTKKLPDFTK
jgi:hypothetical protein